MVLLVLPKLVAGLSPEGGETETSAAVTSVSLTSLFPVMPSCLVSPFCLHVPSLHETHVSSMFSPACHVPLNVSLCVSPMTVSMFPIIHTHSQYRT